MSEFAGSLSQRVEIWERSPDRLATGASATSWTRLCRCLVSIAAEGVGSEAEGMSLSSMPLFRLVARTGPAFALDQQVRWKGKILMIRQIISDPTKPDRIVLRCEEQR